MTTISAIIPTYNREARLVRAVESVLHQTYDDLDVVVVDDHSPKPAEEVLMNSNLDLDSVTIHRHEKNQGGNGARNTGINLAAGEYLAFLDDDDEWVESKIERQMNAIQSSDAEAVYTGVKQVRNGNVVAIKEPDTTGEITPDLLKRPFGGFSSICVSADIFNYIDGMDEDLPSWQEWDFYLRVSEVAKFTSVPQPLVRQHLHDGERISGNYDTKRDVTVPMFLDKHLERAERHGVLDEFQATLAAELGWAAISNEEYFDARLNFLESIKYKRSKKRMLMFVSVLGGERTYYLARITKRVLLKDKKIKSM